MFFELSHGQAELWLRSSPVGRSWVEGRPHPVKKLFLICSLNILWCNLGS